MKVLVLSIVAAAMLALYACGGEEPPGPPPLPAPTNTPDAQATEVADAQATAEASEAATVVAASVQATVESQAVPTDTPVPPTNTPEPEPTPVPPTSTPVPEPTPVPPTNTPEPEPTPVPPTSTPVPEPTPVPPTNTPEPEPTPVPPTSTPAPPPTPEPTPTETPILVGLSWDRSVPIGEAHHLRNTAGLTLRVRDERVRWSQDSWELIDDEDPLNNPPPRDFEYLLIDIQVRNGGSDASAYDAAARLTVEGEPPNGKVYKWSGANHCGGIPRTIIPRDFEKARHNDEYGRRGNICFVVTHDDSGKLVLVDNGAPGAPPEDKRYFSLR